MTNGYHEGKPSLLMTHNRVIVLCPCGHVVEAMPIADWARSHAEAKMNEPVRCYGTVL